MKIKMNLELKDEPGTLARAIVPISACGINIVYIVHDREKKQANGNITVQITVEAEEEQIKKMRHSLEENKIRILSIGEERLIEELTFIMIGHIVDTDIKDTIGRIDETGYAEIVDLELKMPQKKKESSARVTIKAVGKEEMKRCMKIIGRMAFKKGITIVYPVEL